MLHKNEREMEKNKTGIDPQTHLAGDYAKIFGHCAVCGGPIWFNRLIDSLGTPILTYHCWNGHYHAMDEQTLDLYKRGSLNLPPEEIRKILPFIRFIRTET
jgi:hypothetical protein